MDTEDTTEINGSVPENSTDPFEIESVEKILNYEFNNKSLLLAAFTDSTYGEKFSYEREEFLGDSILTLMFRAEFYDLYPEASSGMLTKLVAVNVDTEKLARVAVKHKIYPYFRHKKPLLGDQISVFVKEMKDYPLHSHGLLKIPKSLANITEATIGAIFNDCGRSLEIVWEVIKPLLEPIIYLDKFEAHPVTNLYEMCQKKNLKLTPKDDWEENRDFFFYIEDRLVGHGHHDAKKGSARNRAAKDAIDNFPEIFGDL